MTKLATIAALAGLLGLPEAALRETLTMTGHGTYSECALIAQELDGPWDVQRGQDRAVVVHNGMSYKLKRKGDAYEGGTAFSVYSVRVAVIMRLEPASMNFTTNWNCGWSSR